MWLPDEDEFRKLIKTRLKSELDIASEILNLATGIFTSGGPMNQGDGLDDLVEIVALGLVAKACKQYRAIGELVVMGLGEVADSNARMLFETMLATDFILCRQVTLKQNGKSVSSIKDKPLTTWFRTTLYLAKGAFDDQ
jgi:Family of unknown function (DUF5677)